MAILELEPRWPAPAAGDGRAAALPVIKLFKLSSASDAACVFETSENAICVRGIPDRENLGTRNLELTLGDKRGAENQI